MKDEPAEKVGCTRADPFTVAATIAAVALVMFPVIRATFLPFVDLPQHVALAQLLNHIGDPDISRIYTADLLLQVNILGLLIMASLLAVFPEGAAVVVTIALYVVALAYATNKLSCSIGTSRGNAIIALLFVLNFNLFYGFVSFCLGIPVLILVIARLADTGALTRRRVMLADAALWMLLILAHAILFVFALAASLIWLTLSPLPPVDRIRRLAPAAPAILWALGWYASGRGGLGTSPGAGVALEWHGFAEKLDGFGWSTVVPGVEGGFEWALLCAAGLLVAALLAVELRSSRVTPRGDRELKRKRSRMKLWVRLVALMALALYLLLPYAIVSSQFVTRGVFLLYNRFAVLAPLLLVATLVWPRYARARYVVISAVLILQTMMALHWSGTQGRISRESSGIDGAIEAMAPGKILKSLIYSPYSDVVDLPLYLHAGSYYQGRKLGEVDQSFALLPSTPVHYREPLRPYLSQRDEHLSPHLFDWSQATLYDYILIYDRGGQWRQFYSSAPFERIYERNGWMVLDVENRKR
jgi:hypothetical protein